MPYVRVLLSAWAALQAGPVPTADPSPNPPPPPAAAVLSTPGDANLTAPPAAPSATPPAQISHRRALCSDAQVEEKLAAWQSDVSCWQLREGRAVYTVLTPWQYVRSFERATGDLMALSGLPGSYNDMMGYALGFFTPINTHVFIGFDVAWVVRYFGRLSLQRSASFSRLGFGPTVGVRVLHHGPFDLALRLNAGAFMSTADITFLETPDAQLFETKLHVEPGLRASVNLWGPFALGLEVSYLQSFITINRYAGNTPWIDGLPFSGLKTGLYLQFRDR